MSFFDALKACLTARDIIFCVVAGIIVGIIIWIIREVVTDHAYSLAGHVIISIVFAFLGLVCLYYKWEFSLFSVQSILGSILVAAVATGFLGSSMPKA